MGSSGGGLWLYFVYWGCAALKAWVFFFSQFLSGKGAIFSPTCSLARVRFSWFLSGKGVVFRPNSLARGVFWSWFDTEILARVVIFLFFSGKGGKFWPGKGKLRVCHPGMHTPIHNLVKSRLPPPHGVYVICATVMMHVRQPAWPGSVLFLSSSVNIKHCDVNSGASIAFVFVCFLFEVENISTIKVLLYVGLLSCSDVELKSKFWYGTWMFFFSLYSSWK